jgi:hypothetical protein
MSGEHVEIFNQKRALVFAELFNDKAPAAVGDRAATSNAAEDEIPIKNLCSMLSIPISTPYQEVIDEVRIFRDKWNPEQYVNDPDKYFEAQKVVRRIEDAFTSWRSATGVGSVESKNDSLNATALDSMSEDAFVVAKCLKCGRSVKAKPSLVTIEYDGHLTFNQGGCPCGNTLYFMVNDALPKNCDSRLYEIPTHGALAALAFVIGFGILGAMALGSYGRTKRLIKEGDYDAALKSSSHTFWSSMMIIIGVPILAAIIIFSQPH